MHRPNCKTTNALQRRNKKQTSLWKTLLAGEAFFNFLFFVLFRFSSSTDAGVLRIGSQRQGGSRRITFKKKVSRDAKPVKKGEMSASERLRENIRKYRTEARLLAVDPSSFGDDSEECDGFIDGTSLDQSSVPQSPSVEMEAEIKMTEMSSGERWLKLEAEVSSNTLLSRIGS